MSDQIDPSQVQWDAPPIDPSRVQWDSHESSGPTRTTGAENLSNVASAVYHDPIGAGVGLIEHSLSGITSGAGSLAEALSGIPAATDEGYVEPHAVEPGSISREWAFQPRTDVGKAFAKANGIETGAIGRGYDAAFGIGPLATTLKERIPQAGGAVGTVLGLKAPFDAAEAGSRPYATPGAIEEGHPLTPVAKQEAAELQQHASAAESSGVDLPRHEISPAQQYMNNAPRRDLNLPKNAPITDGLLDAADKQNVGPAFEAAKKTPDYQVGTVQKAALSKVNLNLIDQSWRPPTGGTMSSARAVEMSQQLRSVARGLYSDAENMNLTYAERQSARQAADAHYQAAKAVEAGYRDAATQADAASGTNTRTAIADGWDNARIYKAKLEAWRSTLDGAGNVIGPKVKKMLGDDPITGPMKEAASFAAQYPELLRSTRLATPTPGPIRKTAAALAPAAGAAVGGWTGGPAGAAAGEFAGKYLGDKMLGR